MGHFEDSLFAGVADKLAREGIKYDVGDKVFVSGYASWNDEFAFEVIRWERNRFDETETRTYDVVNKKNNIYLRDVPEYRLRLCETSGRLMSRQKLCIQKSFVSFNPKKVIFHDPATIVLWDDGTKTVVKCSEGDTYDPEKGYMLCYLKRLHGKNYYKDISKTVKKYKED